ncbi:MAG: glycine--tRNA ligase [Proteobacteria bacterium]|nr:glycine--tRNA ligase [Pseudomonadota bacterium]
MTESAAEADNAAVSMDKLVSLCARRGFIFQSSEIYGGINGFWDYGPLGAELKQNLKALWWQRMVRDRDDVEGIDSAIIAHPRTWEASGHVESFSDPMVDCRTCKRRFRADQLEGERCPEAPAKREVRDCDLTEARNFNLMLQTQIGAHEDASQIAYLRPETCQPIFNDFKRVREAARQKIPFGIAQIGKAFRNEITPRNFTFRSREFEQAELEFFVHPNERSQWFDYWLEERLAFHQSLGFRDRNLRKRPHSDDELAHYCARAMDIEFLFPFGWQEIEGIHDRGDWDLSRHSEFSGKDLSITDEQTKERYTPMVIETSVGVDRTCLALLANAYREETLEGGDERVVMGFAPAVAPVKIAVLPLSKKLGEPARKLQHALRRRFNTFYDESGNIGRRYRRQDEIGTPFCVTYDFDSDADAKVTVRDRDSMEQERVAVDALSAYLAERLEASE